MGSSVTIVEALIDAYSSGGFRNIGAALKATAVLWQPWPQTFTSSGFSWLNVSFASSVRGTSAGVLAPPPLRETSSCWSSQPTTETLEQTESAATTIASENLRPDIMRLSLPGVTERHFTSRSYPTAAPTRGKYGAHYLVISANQIGKRNSTIRNYGVFAIRRARIAATKPRRRFVGQAAFASDRASPGARCTACVLPPGPQVGRAPTTAERRRTVAVVLPVPCRAWRPRQARTRSLRCRRTDNHATRQSLGLPRIPAVPPLPSRCRGATEA